MNLSKIQIGTVCVLVAAVAAIAAPAKTQVATFAVDGIMCGMCVPPLQSAITEVEGVTSVNVDQKAKRAVVEFAPDKTDVQTIAKAIDAAKNAHGEAFAGGLVLKVKPTGKDASATRAASALQAVPGVKSAKVNAKGGSATIQFASKGTATMAQLGAALQSSGYKVTPDALSTRGAPKAGILGEGHDHGSGSGSGCGMGGMGGGCGGCGGH
jgi:copper chaperone CopZ